VIKINLENFGHDPLLNLHILHNLSEKTVNVSKNGDGNYLRVS